METIYKAYIKTINGTPFYFVKSYRSFPEYSQVPPVMETYGMHTNFKRACKFAMINDPGIQQQLLQRIENDAPSCKVIPLQTSTTKVYNLKRMHTYFPSFLRLIGLG